MIPWKQQLLPIIELIFWLMLESSKQFASISSNFDTKKNYSSGYEISNRLDQTVWWIHIALSKQKQFK